MLRSLRTFFSLLRRLLALLTLALGPLLGAAAPFTPGNLVVVRLGTGSAALTSVATAVFLDEYTPAGTLVQSIALPTAASGANRRFTNSGSATSEGAVNQSGDGRYLLLGGYDAAVATTGIAGTTSAATNRVVARVDGNGTLDTSTALTDAFSTNNIRSVASTDGTTFYLVGGVEGLRYVSALGATTSTLVSSTSTSNRVVNVFNGQVYFTSGSGTTLKGVDLTTPALPTAAGAVATSAFMSATVTTNTYGFTILPVSPAVGGVTAVAYVADVTSGVSKFTYDGSAWTLRSTLALPNATGLTAVKSATGNGVTLYVTTPTTLYTLADANSSGFTAAISGTATSVATAGTNTAFRGLAFAPTPPATSNISVSTATLALPNTTAAAAGSPASYTVSGTNLGSNPLTITAPAGAEVSLSSGSGYGTSLTLTPSGGTVASTTIYVRLASGGTTGTTVGGNVANASTGATTQNVAVSGKVLPAEPTTQPTVTLSSSTATTATLLVGGGNGSKRLLVLRPAGTAAVAPTDATTYTANLAYGTTTGTNPTTGAATNNGNYVVVADGSTTSVTVTGLTGNTAYVAEAYAYNDNGMAGYENYLPGTPGAASFTTPAPPAVTYTWNGTGTSYSAAASWTPARSAPAASDILVFDGNTTATASTTLDFASPQTIGQLVFRNGVQATWTTDADRTLTLDGNLTGDDLTLDATSKLTVLTSTTNKGLTLSLTAPETAAIAGTLLFDGTATASGRHSLLSAAAGTATANSTAIVFTAGGRFVAGPYFDGSSSNSAFGTSTGTQGSQFSVVFRNGATYEQTGGSNPFALSQPLSFVTFEASANYLFDANSGQPALAGRTYGNLEYATPSPTQAVVTGTSSNTTIQGNLKVTSGLVAQNAAGTITIGGNITVNGTATLSFAPASAGTVSLSGSVAQTLGGSSTAATPISFGPNATLAISNSAGVTLGLPVALAGTLQLTSGLVSTTATTALVLATTAGVSGGSASSYVSGPLRRAVGAVSTATTVRFPVGRGGSYRPLALNITTQTGTTYYQAEQLEADAGTSLNASDPSGTNLQRVNRNRYFTVTPFAGAADQTSTQPSGFAGTITLSFGANDRVTDPSQPTLVVAKRDNGGAWFNAGRTAYTGDATGGTVTSASFGSFSDFTLGSTDASAATNPLPVVLVSFAATRAPSGPVLLTWTTASELNSARFEVERSLDGRTFAPVASVAAQGSRSQASTYTARDDDAPAAALYYRLRQVDLNGTARYSAVLPVAAREAGVALAYPNPTTGPLTMPGGAGQLATLLDTQGRVVRQGLLDAQGRLDLSDLPAGLYLLRVGGQLNQRITKQ